MSLYVDEYLATGKEPGPGHYVLTGRYAWYGIYACADGGQVSVGAIEPAFYRNLLAGLGLDADRFGAAQYDDDAQDELRAALAQAFATRTRDEWTEALTDADCCVAPVLSVPEALAEPQVVARGLVGSATHPTEGALAQLDRIWAGTVRRDGPETLPDATLTDTRTVLAEAGWDTASIDAALQEGAIA